MSPYLSADPVRMRAKLLAVLLCCLGCATLPAQDLSHIGQQKPLVFHGSLGASANFYSSNEPVTTQPPFAWNLYGNFTPQFYGLALPFSFVVNQYSNSYTSPFAQFGISPTYKWVKLLLGYRSMQLSPLTFDGQSFKGIGIELTPGLLRFGAFYGSLNKAVNEDTSSGRYAMPQFSRTAYGVKLGIGNRNSYFDLVYFHAKDDSASANIINKLTAATAQENAVLGASFKISFTRKLIWSGDLAISGLTQDQAAAKVTPDSANASLAKLVGPLLAYNASTIATWAGQSSLSLYLKGFSAIIGYRRVQPDFKSLGTPYMLNDIQLISLANGIQLDKGKVNINTNFSLQHNDLDKKLESELQTHTGNININFLVNRHFNLNMNLSGYTMKQESGTLVIMDSTALDQQIFQLNLTPSYNFTTGGNTHTISGSLNLSALNDNNPVTGPSDQSNNQSASLAYTIYLTRQALNFSVNSTYSNYSQAANSYSSIGLNLGGGAQLLKDKSLNLQGTIGYLFNHYSAGGAKGNGTFSVNAGYHVKQHAFALFANYIVTPANKITSVLNKLPYAVTTNNLAGGISYTYSF